MVALSTSLGEKTFTVMSLHVTNEVTEKPVICLHTITFVRAAKHSED